jgi:RecJ-like exonuclease
MGQCFWCDGTGIYLKPNDEDTYDKAFDYYDDMGIFNLGECRKKALDDSGYERIKCPKCNGTGNSDL